MDTFDKWMAICIVVSFTALFVLMGFGIHWDSKKRDSFKEACFQAGGDFVQRHGKYSYPKLSCWNTNTGQRVLVSGQ